MHQVIVMVIVMLKTCLATLHLNSFAPKHGKSKKYLHLVNQSTACSGQSPAGTAIRFAFVFHR